MAAAAMTSRPRPQGRPPASTAGGLRGRAWWLMRTTGRFTLDDLLLTLADGTERSAEKNLAEYLRGLEAVGVLKRLTRLAPGASKFSRGRLIYRLACDLGPLAPVWRKKSGGEVWDPNAGQTLKPVATAAAATTGQEPA